VSDWPTRAELDAYSRDRARREGLASYARELASRGLSLADAGLVPPPSSRRRRQQLAVAAAVARSAPDEWTAAHQALWERAEAADPITPAGEARLAAKEAARQAALATAEVARGRRERAQAERRRAVRDAAMLARGAERFREQRKASAYRAEVATARSGWGWDAPAQRDHYGGWAT